MSTISTSGISPSQIIRSEHLLRIINALDGTTPNDIIISGSLNALQVTGSFKGDGSQLTGITAGNATLQAGITSNVTVGGATAPITFISGTSLETIIRTMLVTYIPPTLSSLVMRNSSSLISTSTREVGASFTANTASFTAAADNPTSIYPLSASFTASGADIGTVQYYFGNNVLGSSNVLPIGSSNTYTRTTAGSVTFTVNGKRSDTLAAITPATTTMAFQWRNYLGASSTGIMNDSTAQTVVNTAVASTLASSKSWTATCTAANDTLGNFTYIIYPASYGDLASIIQNGATPVLGAFTKIGDFTVTNTFSISLSYRVYKSNSDKAFASGTTLTIS